MVTGIIRSHSQLTVAKVFTDNMMLQCDAKIPVWGHAHPKTTVVVTQSKLKIQAKANEKGEWQLFLNPTPCGEKTSVTITSGSEEILLSNVLYGDVWLCGGQSNMEWYFESSAGASDELQNTDNPSIRLLEIPHILSNTPDNDFSEKLHWDVCSQQSVKQFSAVGYYFGKYLNENLHKPIGLISDNYGGTVVEAWTSAQAFSDLPSFKKDIEKLKNVDFEYERRNGDDAQSNWLAKFYKNDKGILDTNFIWAGRDVNRSDWKQMNLPSYWETAVDSELVELDGVVWFYRKFNATPSAHSSVSLGPIDDSDMVWINGHLVGATYNQYNKDRVYSLSDGILKNGENYIVIRVEDYIGGGGMAGSKDKIFIQTDTEKIPLDGKWLYKIGYRIREQMPAVTFGPNNYPTCLYNGMIAPLKRLPIKGIIWYQGESNASRAYEYRDLFKRFILDMKQQFAIDDLPFIYVQLANFTPQDSIPIESQWAELREAQSMALTLPNTSMITCIDIGDANNIHPSNKNEVGRRLALAALEDVYHHNTFYKSPSLKSFEFENHYCKICFENVGDGLVVDDKFGYIYGFTIAGDDHKFEWAKAELINSNCVKVWSSKIENPISVRYAWQNNPDPANLFNSKGFPCLPFRTDSWDISTQNLKRYND